MALTNTQIIEKLNAQFGESVWNPSESFGMLSVYTDREHIIDVVNFLYNDSSLKFQFLTTLCAVHYPEKEYDFNVVYHLHSLTENVRLRITVPLKKASLRIPTLTKIFLGANWMERETYDFFGVIFEGHPDLRRILNVDDMAVFPMRKEYTLEDPNRSDKDDKYFGR